MSSGDVAMVSLLSELPDEVLLRVLAGAGSKAILRASLCCRRLQTLAKTLQSYRCFSAAASTKSDVNDALAEACERALQGMLGCVDFALVFAANQERLKGALAGKVVEALLPKLPPGTQVIGCAVSGLMGVAPAGAFELDPASGGGGGRGSGRCAGVALLLGRLPGCRVRAFCNLPTDACRTDLRSDRSRRASAVRCTGDKAAASRRSNAANAAVVDWLTKHDRDAAMPPAAPAGPGPASPPTSLTRVPTTDANADAGASGTAAPDRAAATPSGGGRRSRRSSGAGAGAGAGAGGPVGGSAPAVPEAALRSAHELGIQSVWLMMAGSQTAFDLLEGPGGLLHWLQADEQSRPVIAGGVSSGRGDLFFHPGRRRSGPGPGAGASGASGDGRTDAAAADRDDGPSDSARARGRGRGSQLDQTAPSPSATAAAAASEWDPTVSGLQYVGLAVLAGPGAADAGAGAGAPPAAASDAAAAAGEVSGGPAGQHATAAVAAGADTGGTSSGSGGGGGGGSRCPGAPVASEAGKAGLPAVRACALAMRGCAGLPDQPVFERVAISREDLSPRKRLRQAAAPAPAPAGAADEDDSDSDDSDDDDDDAGELVTVSGGASPRSTSLVQELLQVLHRTQSMPQLAVWLAERGDPSIHTGLDVKVFRSGKMVMGLVEPRLLKSNGIVAFQTADVAALDAITAGAGQPGTVVCCQLADITPEGCRLHLQAELPVLRSVCSVYPLLPGGRPDPRSWEGYAVVRRAAQRAGARAGPVAMAVFSCTGRGRAIFGEASAECEARIADEVLQQAVPFVGAYCNGELGPYVRHGYAGWFFNPLCVQLTVEGGPEVAAADPGVAAQGAGMASAGAPAGVEPGGVGGTSGQRGTHWAGGRAPGRTPVMAGGRALPLDRTQMQGYTSVFAALG